MQSLNDRVMDDRNMNMTKYKRDVDVDRLMLERNMMMDGTSERYGENRRDDYDDNGMVVRARARGRSGRSRSAEPEYGELTGTKLIDDTERFDHGMPVRSSFSTRRAEHPSYTDDQDQNRHTDFDLYDRNQNRSTKSRRDVERLYYSEPGDGMYSDISESMQPITEGTDPYETCITGINTSSCWLNDNMASVMRGSYGVSGYSMFGIMGTMYMLSDGEVMADYTAYFEFQEKRKLNAGLLTIRTKLNRFRDQIVMDNYIITSYSNKMNKDTASNIKKLGFVIVINQNNPTIEARRTNDIVYKISGVRNVFSDRTIGSIDSISLVSIIKLQPIFKYAHTVVEHVFNGVRSKFLRFIGVSCGFFEDKEMRLMEMPLKGGSHVLGLIMRKNNQNDYMNTQDDKPSGSIADVKKLSTAINYLEFRALDEVLIPVIDTRFKLRLNTTLQNTGLQSIFTNPNYYKLYPDGAHITDCIQYMDLIISNRSAGAKSTNRGYTTSCKYIANSTFEFYFRDVETNTVFVMGRYMG